jgi:hypothetical protein
MSAPPEKIRSFTSREANNPAARDPRVNAR